MRVPFLPLSPQYLLLFGFVMTAILTGVRWNLNIFWSYTSFMPKDIEYSFVRLSAIWLSFENHPCISSLIYDMRGNNALLKGKFLGTFTWHSHFGYSGYWVDTQYALLQGKCSRSSWTRLRPSLNMKKEKLGPEACPYLAQLWAQLQILWGTIPFLVDLLWYYQQPRRIGKAGG